MVSRRVPEIAAWLSCLVAVAIAAFLFTAAWPLLVSGRIVATLTGPWRPYAAVPAFGIAPMILVSFVLSVAATVLSFPFALGVVAFVQGIGPVRWRPVLLAMIQFMTSIPTVVYGFVAVLVLVPAIRNGLGGGGFSLLGAIVMLALLVLPTIVLVLHSHLARGDRGAFVACLALGMTPAQALAEVVLPAARGAVVAALVLGFCRALGDTLIALMVAGNATQAPDTLLDSARALTAHIALVLATDAFSPEYRTVAAAALVLFLFTAGLSAGLRRLEGSRSR